MKDITRAKEDKKSKLLSRLQESDPANRLLSCGKNMVRCSSSLARG